MQAQPSDRALELSRLVETADSLYLGGLGLDRKQPLFQAGPLVVTTTAEVLSIRD